MKRILVGALALGLVGAFTLQNDAEASRGLRIRLPRLPGPAKIFNAIKNVAPKVGQFATKFTGLAQKFAGKGLGSIVKGLPGIGGVIPKIAGFAKKAGSVLAKGGQIAGQVGQVAGKLAKRGGVIGKLAGSVQGVANRAQSFMVKRSKFFGKFGKPGGITNMLNKFGARAKAGAFSTMGKMLKGAKTGFAPMLRNFGLKKTMAGGFGNRLNGIFTRLGQKGGVKQVGAFMTRFGGKARAAIGGFASNIKARLAALKAKLPPKEKVEVEKIEKETTETADAAVEATDAAAVNAAATAQLPDKEKELADKDDGTAAKIDEKTGDPQPDKPSENADPPKEAVPADTPVEEPAAAAETPAAEGGEGQQ